MNSIRSPFVTARPASYLRARKCACNSFMDSVRDFFERTKFENWAPKSSRAWRLNQAPKLDTNVSDSDDLAEALELRMKQLSADAQTLQSMDTRSVRAPPSPIDSFSSADDDDIAAALALRLDGGDGGDTEPIDDQAPLSALELATLVASKYGKKYDVTIARRTFAGKDFVSLNVMWVHLDQKSFPMTPEEYLDKLDGIAMLLTIWERQAYVRSFFRAKPSPRNGMPARPIVGTAVALQLDLPPEQVQEYLGARLG